MAITPDTKDWTWVLERVCPECGFDVRTFSRERTGAMLREIAVQWRQVLAREDVRRRPSRNVWSPLEYACHVRDVFRIFDERLMLMLTEDDPHFANWDQDATAVEDRYDEQDPVRIAELLALDAEVLADHFDGVQDDEWTRTGARSDGAQFTVESLARYLIHDPMHHLHDVAPVEQAGAEEQARPSRRRTRVPDRGDGMATPAGTETPTRTTRKSTGRRRSTRTAKRTSARATTAARKTTARKTTARKTTARKTTARKTTARKTTARKTTARKATVRKTTARKTAVRAPRRTRSAAAAGALASSLSVLMEQLDAQIASVNGLSDTIDSHVSSLNQLRADQQLQVAALLEMREAAGRAGTLASYIDERLAELRHPSVPEAALPWPRR